MADDAMEDKTEFLVAYDYGMGGLWGILFARSVEEIAATYPELIVVDESPEWLTPEELQRLREKSLYDIDDEPWGMLRAVVAERRK